MQIHEVNGWWPGAPGGVFLSTSTQLRWQRTGMVDAFVLVHRDHVRLDDTLVALRSPVCGSGKKVAKFAPTPGRSAPGGRAQCAGGVRAQRWGAQRSALACQAQRWAPWRTLSPGNGQGRWFNSREPVGSWGVLL